jgi:hypothetical protein
MRFFGYDTLGQNRPNRPDDLSPLLDLSKQIRNTEYEIIDKVSQFHILKCHDKDRKDAFYSFVKHDVEKHRAKREKLIEEYQKELQKYSS